MTICYIFSVLFPIIYYLLRNVFSSEWILTIGIGCIAWAFADIFSKIAINVMPKVNINPDRKAVFITGCDSGFGHELAKKLDVLGFYVYAGCLLPDQEGAQKLKSSCSDRLQIIELDVTSDEQVKAAAKKVESTLDGKILWSVVNNAGIAIFTEIEWCPLDTYRKMFEVNAMGPIRVTKAFLPILQESQGRVVIVASLAGRYTLPGFSAYSMSKYAVVSFADALRREMKKWNISVHTVEPTSYKTPLANYLVKVLNNIWESTPSEMQETYGQEYFQAFQQCLVGGLDAARGNIDEVVTDLIDAVAGSRPKTRYVPSLYVQFQAKLILSMPAEMQDYLLGLVQPRILPARKHILNAQIYDQH